MCQLQPRFHCALLTTYLTFLSSGITLRLETEKGHISYSYFWEYIVRKCFPPLNPPPPTYRTLDIFHFFDNYSLRLFDKAVSFAKKIIYFMQQREMGERLFLENVYPCFLLARLVEERRINGRERLQFKCISNPSENSITCHIMVNRFKPIINPPQMQLPYSLPTLNTLNFH